MSSKQYSKTDLHLLLNRYVSSHSVFVGDDYKLQTNVTIQGRKLNGAYLIYKEKHKDTVYEKPKTYYYYVDLENQQTLAIKQGREWFLKEAFLMM